MIQFSFIFNKIMNLNKNNLNYSHIGGGVQLGPLGTSATDWPIVLVTARVIIMLENLVE
jgi:hypothetical protein